MTCVIRDRDMRLNSSERKKILFVDDDSDITTISKAALERNGFEVQTYESSLSALENFKPGSYDLLVVDIKMRDMNGFRLKYSPYQSCISIYSHVNNKYKFLSFQMFHTV